MLSRRAATSSRKCLAAAMNCCVRKSIYARLRSAKCRVIYTPPGAMLPGPPCFRCASQLGLGPFRFAQRARAALRAISDLFSGVSFFKRARTIACAAF